MKGVLLFVLGCFVSCCCGIPLDSSYLQDIKQPHKGRRLLTDALAVGFQYYAFGSSPDSVLGGYFQNLADSCPIPQMIQASNT